MNKKKQLGFHDFAEEKSDSNLNEQLSTERMLNNFFAPEIMDGSEKVTCDHCKMKTKSEKQLSVYSAPEHLMINFKRFTWDFKTGKRFKILKAVTIPSRLFIPLKNYNLKKINKNNIEQERQEINDGETPKQYLHELNIIIPNVSNKSEMIEQKQAEYVLYAVVVHSGQSAEYGHYYTIGRHCKQAVQLAKDKGEMNTGDWFMFNDRLIIVFYFYFIFLCVCVNV